MIANVTTKIITDINISGRKYTLLRTLINADIPGFNTKDTIKINHTPMTIPNKRILSNNTDLIDIQNPSFFSGLISQMLFSVFRNSLKILIDPKIIAIAPIFDALIPLSGFMETFSGNALKNLPHFYH